jgi:hypothetical protein
MRRLLALLMIGICLLNTGCELASLMHCNLSFEQDQRGDHRWEKIRNHFKADAAWACYRKANRQMKPSDDFAAGFKDGFTACLEGNAPSLPPSKYWKGGYHTQQGCQAIHDWFAGFHEGTLAAQASGLTQYSTVPAGGPACLSHCPAASAAAVAPADEAMLPHPKESASPWAAPALEPAAEEMPALSPSSRSELEAPSKR